MTSPAASPVDALPCPFCGGAPQSRAFGHTWYVECSLCGATTRGTTTVETSVAAWSARQPWSAEIAVRASARIPAQPDPLEMVRSSVLERASNRLAFFEAALSKIRFSGNAAVPIAIWMQKVAAHAMEPDKLPDPGAQP